MKITLLFGAGASRPLNVPTTKEMADKFVKETSNWHLKRRPPDKIEDIEKVILLIRNVVDLEENEGIRILKETDEDKIAKTDLATLCKEFKRTEEEVTKYVRAKCIKPDLEEAKKLHGVILEPQKRGTAISVFTTNYDTAVENICDELNIPFTDGFKRDKRSDYPVFDPSEFDRGMQNNEVIIYKLHGSVNWWWNDERKVIFKLSDMDLTSLPNIRNLMIYPARKEERFNAPYNVLETAFILELHKTHHLIAIGHKFGDVNISSAVRVALERPNFKLTIVNREASKIKKDVFNDSPRVEAIDKSFQDWVHEGVKFLNDEIAKYTEKLQHPNNWVVESYQSHRSPGLFGMTTFHEAKLRCPNCGNSRRLETQGSIGTAMCENCKKKFGYNFND